MAGHSKWSKVKHIKGPLDVKRGAAFSKLVKEITVAARLGGGDPAGNTRLRPVVETARAVNLPEANIESAIPAVSQKQPFVSDNNVSVESEDGGNPQNVYSNFDFSEEVLACLAA